MMRYSVKIERDIDSCAYCFNELTTINNMYDWDVRVYAGGIDYGIYLNFDIKNKQLDICNQARYSELYSLDEIIDIINDFYED